MTAEDVKRRVEADIRERTANQFGWDFRPFMLPIPIRAEYADWNGRSISLWTVLVESDVRTGYHVVFDPEARSFGLATSGVWIGNYGSFADALDAM